MYYAGCRTKKYIILLFIKFDQFVADVSIPINEQLVLET